MLGYAGSVGVRPGSSDRNLPPLRGSCDVDLVGDPQITDPALKATATRIAEAAARLNALRENWLNPPEWTERMPEVVPLGLDKSPYPDRIVPRAGLSDADAKALQKRTLTNLYNQRPAWLAMAHEALDAAVAAAYGWADYTPEMNDDEILARLLALNLQRAGGGV